MRFNLHEFEARSSEEAARNRLFRSLASCPDLWTVAGKQIRVMTLRDYRTLCIIGAPAVCGDEYSDEAVAQLLWLLSPEFCTDEDLRTVFALEVFDHLPDARAELDEYLDFLFLDDPPSRSDGKRVAVSFDNALIHAFAMSYGWTSEQTLSLQVPQAFQLLKLIQRSNNPSAPTFDGSEDAKSRFLQWLNTVPVDERAEIIERANRGETIEIPD